MFNRLYQNDFETLEIIARNNGVSRQYGDGNKSMAISKCCESRRLYIILTVHLVDNNIFHTRNEVLRSHIVMNIKIKNELSLLFSFFFPHIENMVATLWLLSLLSTTLLSTSECVYASPLAKYRLSDTSSIGIQVNLISTSACNRTEPFTNFNFKFCPSYIHMRLRFHVGLWGFC